MIQRRDWPLVLVLILAVATLAALEIWAYRIGREGKQWRLFDMSNPMNWLGPLAVILLPAYAVGRARPYPSRVKIDRNV